MAPDFTSPAGEPALIPPDSVAWQVFRNPVTLFIGGVAAVLLELAEPRVRAGVWHHSSFRTDPVDRLRRTGLAAMVTVYAARSVAEEMIARVRAIHEQVQGRTREGESYRANDAELLDWVQATAMFGFVEAYRAYVRPLTLTQRNLFYAEGRAAARLYGAVGAPQSVPGMDAQFAAMRPKLGRSEVPFEFLRIMRRAPILPPPLRPLQAMLIRAAVEILPGWAREIVGLGRSHRLRPFEATLVRQIGRTANGIRLRNSPAVASCLRLRLPEDYLWKAAATSASMRSSSPS
jgi:uncharacterized protein (DUF2236 family)